MSTSYVVRCGACRKVHHLGTRFTSSWTFGRAANDDASRERAGHFILDHKGPLVILSEHDLPEEEFVLEEDETPEQLKCAPVFEGSCRTCGVTIRVPLEGIVEAEAPPGTSVSIVHLATGRHEFCVLYPFPPLRPFRD